jgi:hypothetical protein
MFISSSSMIMTGESMISSPLAKIVMVMLITMSQ